jgi:hypothetical protein
MKESRRPGRPALTEGDTPAHVNLTMPSKDYDRAHKIARRDGVSVPEVLRRGLARVLSEDDAGDD